MHHGSSLEVLNACKAQMLDVDTWEFEIIWLFYMCFMFYTRDKAIQLCFHLAPAMFSSQCYITVISWRDHWRARVHNLRQFYTGGGERAKAVIIFWRLLWFWCGHSAVTPDQSPRLHFKSVCHEHHQVTLSSVTKLKRIKVMTVIHSTGLTQ